MILSKKTARIWDDGNTNFLATNIQDIAAALVKWLRDAQTRELRNRVVHISSFSTTQNETLRLLEKFSGAKFTATQIDSDRLRQESLADLSNGKRSAIIPLIQYGALGRDVLCQWYEEAKEGGQLLLPAPQESLEETVQRVVTSVAEVQPSFL